MIPKSTLLMVALLSALGALGGGAGCNLVFEAGQPQVDIWFVTDEIRNDTDGAPIVQRLVTDLAGWQIDYSFDGEPAQPAHVDLRTGHIWFERVTANTPYAVTVRAPGQAPLIFHGVAAQHYEATTHYGRLDAEAETVARQITLPRIPTGASLMVASTGTYANLSSTDCGSNCDWKLATSFEQPQLPDAAFGDRVYGLLHTVTDDKSVVTGSSVQSWQLSRRPETLLAPTPSLDLQSFSTPANLMPLCALLMGLAPQQPGRLTAWQILAVPTLQNSDGQEIVVPPKGHPLVLFPSIPKTVTLCADSNGTSVAFANPFPRTIPVMRTNAGVLYAFTTPGAINDLRHLAFLGSGIEAYTRANATAFPEMPDGALPRNITVNGTAVVPEQPRIVPYADLQLTWTKSSSERVDDWVIHIRRLYTDAAQFSKSEIVATLRTVATSITVPVEFVPPGDYVLSVEARLGYPGAATQDYRRRDYPFWSANALAARIIIE